MSTYFIVAFFIVGGILVVAQFISGGVLTYSDKLKTQKQKEKGLMFGLFYKRVNGEYLFIVKTWLYNEATEMKEQIISKNSGTDAIFQRDTFEKQYKEQFDGNSLIIKNIGPEEMPNPKYSRLYQTT